MAGEILVGYDGQPGAKAALHAAVAAAAAFTRPVVIVFGYAPAAIGGETADMARAVRDLGEAFTHDAEAIVHGLDASIETSVELVNDRPADALLRACDQYEPLMLVVGAASRGPVTGGLLGSVTYQVVHRSTVPVLVVPVPDDE